MRVVTFIYILSSISAAAVEEWEVIEEVRSPKRHEKLSTENSARSTISPSTAAAAASTAAAAFSSSLSGKKCACAAAAAVARCKRAV